jgi:CubicO group peptidase (beta-lactamase class C family)
VKAVSGTVSSGFDGVRDAFERAQQSDLGQAQLCVYQDGQIVVDLWTERDDFNDRDNDADTITVLMSCSKALVATCLHILRERGLIDLDAPVSRYWPEFAANGKEAVTVRHLLTHAAGLPTFQPEDHIGQETILDWDACVTSLGRMAPLFDPGSAFYYHTVTFGFLVGEVVRRVSGKSAGTFFNDEIASPLGLDLWIGLPAEQEHRVAPQFNARGERTTTEVRSAVLAYFEAMNIDLETPLMRAVLASINGDVELNQRYNSREGHAAEVPAGNGIGNARSLAKVYAAMIGEVDGVRLLNAETVNEIRQAQTDDLSYPWPLSDLPAKHRPQFGLGYEISRDGAPMLGTGGFGHTGMGGRLGFAHPELGVGFGYVCNNMLWEHEKGPDVRWVEVVDELKNAIA